MESQSRNIHQRKGHRKYKGEMAEHFSQEKF